MQNKSSLKKLVNPLFRGITFGFGLMLIIGVAYAFSTWNSGLAPQASPANGNVQLATGGNTTTTTTINNPIPSGLYGLCYSNLTASVRPCALAAGLTTDIIRCVGKAADKTPKASCWNCGCACISGYTLMQTGLSYDTSAASGGEVAVGGNVATVVYSCLKN